MLAIIKQKDKVIDDLSAALEAQRKLTTETTTTLDCLMSKVDMLTSQLKNLEQKLHEKENTIKLQQKEIGIVRSLNEQAKTIFHTSSPASYTTQAEAPESNVTIANNEDPSISDPVLDLSPTDFPDEQDAQQLSSASSDGSPNAFQTPKARPVQGGASSITVTDPADSATSGIKRKLGSPTLPPAKPIRPKRSTMDGLGTTQMQRNGPKGG